MIVVFKSASRESSLSEVCMTNITNITELLAEENMRGKNVMPYAIIDGVFKGYTGGKPAVEWKIFVHGGREVLYTMTREYPYVSNDRYVAEIHGYCELDKREYLGKIDMRLLVSFIEKENREELRRKLQSRHGMVVFYKEQEEIKRQRDEEWDRLAAICPKGGMHQWTNAECFDAYGIEYTLTCGKCGKSRQTTDWQTAIGIQVQNIGMEVAKSEMGCVVSGGCSTDAEEYLQEAKDAAAEALRLVQEGG